MISILSSKAAPSKVVDGATKSREVFCLVGLSSDTKPTTSYKGILICNGSVYDEIDTGKEYLYDEAGGEWHEQPEGDKKKDDPTAEEISVSRGSADAGKVIVVGNDGKLLPVDLEVGEGQVAVDGTLKIPGAAADAKKTGDAIASLNGSLDTLINTLPTDTASGSVVSFTDGADDIPLKSLVVGITGTQGGRCDVAVCGVNVWDEEWELGSYNNTNGEPATYTDRIRNKNRISVVPNTEYFFKTSNGLTAGNVYFYDVNDVFISARTTIGNNVITTPNKCKYMRIAMGLPYGATYNNDVSINYPSSDHDYHPYVGQSISISWDAEIQNGTVDVINGIVTDTDMQTEYQVEAHEVKSLLGFTTIYATTGDVSVEYRADIKKYIDKVVATAISALS